MRTVAALLSMTMLAGLLSPARSQTKAPDPAEVARLQKDIAKEQAKGDYKSVALDLRILARFYKNDPAMLSTTYSQLAQVSTQMNDEKKAAEYRALAQSSAGSKAATAAAQLQTAPVPVVSAQPFPTSTAPPPSVTPTAPAPKTSASDKLTNIFAQAKQIMEEAKQVRLTIKPKETTAPQPGQATPGPFPAAPDGSAPSSPQPAPAEVAPAPGVVIGYDANNQPIFASQQPAPATAGSQTAPAPPNPIPPR